MTRAILKAVATAVRRDLAGYQSVRANNFFLFVALLIGGALESGTTPYSAEPFVLVLAVLLFFPASSDPLDKIPAVRLALWPLSHKSRIALRLASLALSPMTWIAVAILIARGTPALTTAFVAATIVSAYIRKRPSASVPEIGRLIPGAWGLAANELRQMLTLLDTWLALLISAGAVAWRCFATHPDPAAYPVFSILIGIALSTRAQCPFGLDGASGLTRLKLLPLRAWQILLWKDAAYLGVQLLLTAALSPAAGVAFGLAAIAFGRYPAIRIRLRQHRWRFATGRVWFGVLQGVAGSMLGWNAIAAPAPALGTAAALYFISLYWAARAGDAQA